MPFPAHRPTSAPATRPALGRSSATSRQAGQSLAEFALVLLPLFTLLLAIIQFGFVFNTYVTVTNAVREGAREGSIYVYDRTKTKAQNDLLRNERVRSSLLASFNLLRTTSPQFANSAVWTQSGLTFTTGDLKVTYAVPGGVTDSDPRPGQRLTVQATYHLDLIVPLVANFLPRDAGGRLPLVGEATMVIN